MYCVAGDGLYFQHGIGSSWKQFGSLPPYYKTAIRGININNIAVAGDLGLLLHYNGMSWKNCSGATFYPGLIYGHVAIKENLIVASGFIGNNAVAAIGRRK